MLSSYWCSMTCLKWLRLLNVTLKESCVVFVIWEHIIVVFSFDAIFGLIWCMLTPCLNLTSRLKPLLLSMDFVSQEHGVPCDGPKDSNAGGWTCEILDRNETRWQKPRLSDVQRTAERETELYPGSGPSWLGKTPTSCLLVLQRDTSRGVQGLGYKALAGQRLKNLRTQLAAWRRSRFDPP
jgi:hypothetical protein